MTYYINEVLRALAPQSTKDNRGEPGHSPISQNLPDTEKYGIDNLCISGRGRMEALRINWDVSSWHVGTRTLAI
jgi:hypothetical protein